MDAPLTASDSKTAKARVIIADDHSVVRAGIKALLEDSPKFAIVAEAEDGLDVMPLIQELSPNIVILDMEMPNLSGMQVLAQISKLSQPPIVLILSGSSSYSLALDALALGAKGFLPKSGAAPEIVLALQTLLEGKNYLSPLLKGGQSSNTLSSKNPELDPCKGKPLPNHRNILSPREQEIARMLCQGIPNRLIAKELGISVRTVDTHRQNILNKLDADSNVELLKVALEMGLLKDP